MGLCSETRHQQKEASVTKVDQNKGGLNFSDIAKEAEKIAHLLSESANKYAQSRFPNDIEDNTISCEPSLLRNSNVCDLQKDSELYLCINCSGISQSLLKIEKSLEDSDALKYFKSLKKRQSLGTQTNDDCVTDSDIQSNDKSLQQSQSLGSRLQDYNPPTSRILSSKTITSCFYETRRQYYLQIEIEKNNTLMPKK